MPPKKGGAKGGDKGGKGGDKGGAKGGKGKGKGGASADDGATGDVKKGGNSVKVETKKVLTFCSVTRPIHLNHAKFRGLVHIFTQSNTT